MQISAAWKLPAASCVLACGILRASAHVQSAAEVAHATSSEAQVLCDWICKACSYKLATAACAFMCGCRVGAAMC